MVYHPDPLGNTFGALADPTRREIVARLAAGDRTIGELASGFAMSLPAVSKHVQVLRRAGLAVVTRDGRSRRCTLVAAPMRDAVAWLERYREHWQGALDRLAAYLEETTPQEEKLEWRKRRAKADSGSKSGATSQRRGSASGTRGRKRKR